MGGDIVEMFYEIVGACNDGVAAHYYGADWHLVFVKGLLRFAQCAFHEVIVVKHG